MFGSADGRCIDPIFYPKSRGKQLSDMPSNQPKEPINPQWLPPVRLLSLEIFRPQLLEGKSPDIPFFVPPLESTVFDSPGENSTFDILP